MSKVEKFIATRSESGRGVFDIELHADAPENTRGHPVYLGLIIHQGSQKTWLAASGYSSGDDLGEFSTHELAVERLLEWAQKQGRV